MKKLLLFILPLLFFIGCRDDSQKLKFVDIVVNKPEKIEEFLERDTTFIEKPFLEKYYQNDTTKQEFLQKLRLKLDKHYSEGYTVFCNRKLNRYNPKTGRSDYFHEITIVGDSKDWMLKFQWMLQYGRWRLLDIFFTASEYCK